MVKLLSNEDFLSELSKLFQSNSSHASIFLTQKRFTFTQGDVPKKRKVDDLSDLKSKETFPLLIRASDGNKSKISTFVTQEGLEEFFSKYSEVCKNGMGALKKRDRKKEKAKKEKKKEKK